MTSVRVLLLALLAALAFSSVGCSGPSGCSSSIPGQSGGSSTGGSGGATPPSSGCTLPSPPQASGGVYLLVADSGAIQGAFVDTTNKKIGSTPGFGTVTVSTASPGDFMVVAQQKFMYTAYTDLGQINAWSVSGKGLLTALNPPSITAPYLTNTPITGTNLGTANAGWQGMITNPAGTLLFVVDQTPGSGAVEVYQIGSDGLLSGPTTTLLPSGFLPFNLAIDGLGKYLYVSNVQGTLTNAIMAYSVDASGGLTPVPNSPFASPIQQMQGEATGTYMIGTSGGQLFQNIIYVAAIQSDGELTVAPTAVLGPPLEVVVQPNAGGNLVYAVDFPLSSNDGKVEGFTFDVSTGTLTEMTNSPLASVLGAHGEFDPTGQFFFLSSSTGDSPMTLSAFDTKASPDLSTVLAATDWAPGAWANVDGQ